MTAQELHEVRRLKYQIEQATEELDYLRGLTTRLRNAPSSAKAHSRVEALAIKRIDGEKILASLHEALETARDELMDKILAAPLTSLERDILLLRYVDCLSFRAIARTTHYSLAQIFRTHDKIVAEMEHPETP